MTDRSAIDTIKGYFYQFDYTVDCILNLSDSGKIIIEGIEDVDLTDSDETKAVQCKYYSKTEYNHSVIAKPIRLMLHHYSEVIKSGKTKVKYMLRGHYKSGHSKLHLPLDVKTLKENFLTYTTKKIKYEEHKILSLNDCELTDFLMYLEIDINAVDFDDQTKKIIGDLKSIYNCSELTAQNFYYNSALNAIKELSIKTNIKDRTISKKDFLKKIDTKKIIFNDWLLQLKGEKTYFQNLRKEYFTFLNISPFERFFLIEIDPVSYNRFELKELIYMISRKWSKLLKREPNPFCPYVYIHNLDKAELVELKKEIIAESFYIYDGYDFEGATFNPDSILRKADFNSKVGLKMINSLSSIDLILSKISKTKEIYQFYFKSEFYSSKDLSIKHVPIQIGNISNIKNII